MFGSSARGCDHARADLVAWIDGGLERRHAQRLDRHVNGCAACAVEAEALRAGVCVQRELLQRHCQADAVDLDALWRRVQSRIAEPDAAPAWRMAWVWRPALAVAATVLLLTFGVTTVGGPDTVLISLGVEAPPPPLKAQPELFKDYPIIQQLDVLERFDTADTEPVDDGVTPAAEEG